MIRTIASSVLIAPLLVGTILAAPSASASPAEMDKDAVAPADEAPICVYGSVDGELDTSIEVYNDCPVPQRVRVIMALWPDSDCMTLQPYTYQEVFKGGQFEGLETC